MRLLFVVNPISGYGYGKKLPEKLAALPEYRDKEYDIHFTEYPGHAREIVAVALKEGEYTHIVAVGGDGTVNEVGTTLCGSGVIFGIVSIGSGNGFARHLGYSTCMRKALKQLLSPACAPVDVLEINGVYSLNVSGVGFDAEVAHEFNRLHFRGIISYIYAGMKTWFRYTEKEYRLTCDGETFAERCFILSFANSSQFGNNASIAPHASLRDGLMDICLLKRPRWWEVLPFLVFLMNGRIDRLGFYKVVRCREALVEGDIRKVHIDGDAAFMHPPLELKVHRGVLNAVVPKFSGRRGIH